MKKKNKLYLKQLIKWHDKYQPYKHTQCTVYLPNWSVVLIVLGTHIFMATTSLTDNWGRGGWNILYITVVLGSPVNKQQGQTWSQN